MRQQCLAELPFYRKGIRLIFLNQNEGDDGNVNEVRDVGRNPGKSCLFFLTDVQNTSTVESPRNRFIRRWVVEVRQSVAIFAASGALRTALENRTEWIYLSFGRTEYPHQVPKVNSLWSIE